MKRYRRLRAASGHAALLISLLAISAPASGEEVSGKVYLNNQPFVGKLKLPDGSEIEINGEYRIFVAAGDYQVTFEHEGQPFPATIHSTTVPVNKDIYLPAQ